VGWEELAGTMGALYPPQLHLHHFVVVEAPADAADDDQEAPPPAVAVAYDFLPADASSPITAARLLSGGSVPGEVWKTSIALHAERRTAPSCHSQTIH
jgi:hypothetical protein